MSQKSTKGADTTTHQHSTYGRSFKKVDKLWYCRRGVDLNELLYDLLERATPNPHEDLIRALLPKGGKEDEKGNVHFHIGVDTDPKTMFSCHMDTVHRKQETIRLAQTKEGMVFGLSPDGKEYSILGADDKLGVYVMCRMIEKKIPGYYVFHVEEERGGIGSSWLAKDRPDFFKKFQRCVAFDRKAITSIITAQRGVCCSDDFALALAKQLNDVMQLPMAKWVPDPTGTFTDSANYSHIIPECTNLSVGYYNQHTQNEHFDSIWLESMFLPAVFQIDWEGLPTVRKPVERYQNYARTTYRSAPSNNLVNYTSRANRNTDRPSTTPNSMPYNLVRPQRAMLDEKYVTDLSTVGVGTVDHFIATNELPPSVRLAINMYHPDLHGNPTSVGELNMTCILMLKLAVEDTQWRKAKLLLEVTKQMDMHNLALQLTRRLFALTLAENDHLRAENKRLQTLLEGDYGVAH